MKLILLVKRFAGWTLILGISAFLVWDWHQLGQEKYAQINAYAKLACAHHMSLLGQPGSPDDCDIISADASGLMNMVEYSILYKGNEELYLIVGHKDGLLSYDVGRVPIE